MAFQLGELGLRKFRKANAAIQKRAFEEAGEMLLLSKWAEQDTPKRAQRAVKMFVSGEWDERLKEIRG